jgi:hypothetical protein
MNEAAAASGLVARKRSRVPEATPIMVCEQIVWPLEDVWL